MLIADPTIRERGGVRPRCYQKATSYRHEKRKKKELPAEAVPGVRARRPVAFRASPRPTIGFPVSREDGIRRSSLNRHASGRTPAQRRRTSAALWEGGLLPERSSVLQHFRHARTQASDLSSAPALNCPSATNYVSLFSLCPLAPFPFYFIFFHFRIPARVPLFHPREAARGDSIVNMREPSLFGQ